MRFVYQLCAKILLNGCDTAADANVLILRSILRPPQHPSPAAASFARRSILRPLQAVWMPSVMSRNPGANAEGMLETPIRAGSSHQAKRQRS
jgi:hypothetical protein